MRALLAVGVLAACLTGCGGQGKRTTSTSADYGTLVGAGLHLLRAGNTPAAAQLFEQAVAKDAGDPTAHYDLGVVDQRDGNARAALLQYTRALAADPNYIPALYNKAVLLGMHHRLLSIFYYRKVISLQPRAAAALLNLGLLLGAEGATRAAGVRALSTAVRLQPSLRKRIPGELRALLPRATR